jgi:hypothetical protein
MLAVIIFLLAGYLILMALWAAQCMESKRLSKLLYEIQQDYQQLLTDFVRMNEIKSNLQKQLDSIPSLDQDNSIYRKLCDDNNPKHFVWLRLVETGRLQEEQEVNGEELCCRLSGETNQPIDSVHYDLWKNFKSQDAPPPDRQTFNLAAAKQLLDFCDSALDNDQQPDGNFILEAIKTITSGKGNGGLSYNRISTIKLLKKATQKYLSFYDEIPPGLPTAMRDQRDSLERKLTAIRNERCRVTVNLSLKLLLEKKRSGKPIIAVCEDLTLEASSSQEKWLNRQIDVWCPKRIVKELKRQAQIIDDMYIWAVPAYKTSWEDFATGEGSPRLEVASLKTFIDNTYWYKEFNNLFIFPPNPKEFVNPLLKRSWEKLLRNWLLTDYTALKNFAQKTNGQLYELPKKTGHFIRSAAFGQLMNADDNAACNIGLRGTKSILKWYKKKDLKKSVAKVN